MNFTAIPTGAEVFVDANTLIYHFTQNARYGAACTDLLDRIEHQDVRGYSSTHALGDVVHRLMTLEAMHRRSWPATRLAARLKTHHDEIPSLTLFRQALIEITQIGLIILPITEPLVHAAAALSQQFELLTGDALIVATMQQHGLTALASEDADFDRVPSLTRYAPA